MLGLIFSKVELEPKGIVGLLAADTEIHINPPKPKPRVGPLVDHKKQSLKTILSQLLTQHLPETTSDQLKANTVLELRVLPVEDNEMFHQLALESNPEMVMQPYTAFLSNKVYRPVRQQIQNYIGCIQNGERSSYFTVNLVKNSQKFPIFSNAIYLSEALIRQLKLNVKQRIEVLIQTDDPPIRCDSVSFYTFVQVSRYFPF